VFTESVELELKGKVDVVIRSLHRKINAFITELNHLREELSDKVILADDDFSQLQSIRL
jgi:hypothetical protein